MMTLKFAGNVAQPDQEPWGKAFTYSLFVHSALVALFLLKGFGEQVIVKPMLTEIKFVEVAPAPVVEPAPAHQDDELKSGDRKVSGARLGTAGGGKVANTHPNNPHIVPFSGKEGDHTGKVIVTQKMSGPIIPLEQMDMVGVKKGSLKTLAGRTIGPKGVNSDISLPPGPAAASGQTIVLEKQAIADVKSQSKIGSPIVGQQAVTDSMGGRIKQLASASVGEKRLATSEKLKANPLDKEKWGDTKGPFSMEGPLKYRKILKMELPPYPRWAEEQGLEASVSYRLWVDPKGRVKENMYLEKTSGYPELDTLAKDALMKFVFITLPSNQAQEDEWGVATFRFELKK